MSLPWVQVERDFLSVRALELAGELGTSVPHAAGLMLMLWSWCQARGSGEVRGRNWRRSIEIAAGWDGESGAFADAVLTCDLAQSLEDGVRVRGLDRYEAAKAKAKADRDRLAAKRALGRESQSHARKQDVAATSQRHSRDSRPDVGGTVDATSPGRDVRRQIATSYEVAPPVSPPQGDAPLKRESLPPGPSNDELFGAGNSLRDALEQRWQEATGAPYAWDERRDGHATRRILQLAGDDAREVLRRWDVALATRYPRPTSVADLARHWNAYAAAEAPPPGPKRAADVPAAAPPPSGACAVQGCQEAITAEVWGQRLCGGHAVELMDEMGTSPSTAAASRWVGERKRGVA